MIAELESYRAVFCACCNEPIPISAKIASIQDEVEHERTNAPRAFIARCKLCEYERVYTMDEITEVEGEPRRRTRARAAGM